MVLRPWLEHGISRFGENSKIRTYNLYSLTTAGCQFPNTLISRVLSPIELAEQKQDSFFGNIISSYIQEFLLYESLVLCLMYVYTITHNC